MAKNSGLAQTIYVVIGTVVGGLILAGLAAAYFSNLLPWVLSGIGLFIVFAGPIIYGRWAKAKAKAKEIARFKTGEEAFQRLNAQRRTPIVAPPKKRLKHVVTVSLDTEVVPFGYRSEWFEKGDVIEVEDESEEGASFHFMVATDRQLRINKRRSVNFEFYEGMEFTTQFKKQFEIPESGMWHFIAYTPYEEDYTKVTLTVSKVE